MVYFIYEMLYIWTFFKNRGFSLYMDFFTPRSLYIPPFFIDADKNPFSLLP